MTESRQNPFVGPRALEKGEPLFGRSEETIELSYLLIPERIVLLYSPSGAGKTSLLQAALIHKLEAEEFLIVDHLLRVNLPPPSWSANIPNFNRFSFSVLSSLEEARPEDEWLPAKELAGLRLVDYLADRVEPRMVLLFDQFEEVLTIDPTELETKHSFFRELGAALADKSIWALFALREDYVAGLDPYRSAVPTRFRNSFRLDRLTKYDAMAAIQKTAQGSGVDFTDAAAEHLINDLAVVKVQGEGGKFDERAGEYVEPMHLQVVCRNLWRKLDPGDADITEQEIGEIGDVDQSLSEYYADEIRQIAASRKVSERKIRTWVERELIAENGVRKPVLMGEDKSADLENDVIQDMVNRHLLRREPRHGAIWFELAHDRLVRPVQIDNHEWFAQNLNLLQKQADLWDRQGRPASLLLAGGELQTALDWARAHPNETLGIEDAFLDESIEQEAQARAQIEQEKEVAIAKQKALFQHQRAEALRRRNQLITGLGFVALVLAAVAAFLGWSASVNAQAANAASTQAIAGQNAAVQAESTAVVARSTAEVASTLAFDQKATAEAASAQAVEERNAANTASTQIAVERKIALTAQAAAEVERDAAATARAETEVQLMINRANSLAAQALESLDEDISRALLLSVEAILVADTVNARSALLSALQRKLERQVVQHGAPLPFSQYGDISAVRYSLDGRQMAFGTNRGEVLLYEPDREGSLRPFAAHQSPVLSVAFHPNGRYLATGDRNRIVRLWDLETGELIIQLPANDWVLSLDFSPDGRFLASGGSGINRRVFLWDIQDPENTSLVAQLNDPRDDVRVVTWSPDGSLIAAGEFSFGFGTKSIWVWDVASRQVLRRLAGHPDAIWSVAWSPDGRLLASGDELGNIYLWEYSTGQRLAMLPRINDSEVVGLAFGLDGNTLISLQGSGVLGIWDVEEGSLQLQAQTSQGIPNAFNPGRNQVSIGTPDNNLALWDLQLDQPLRAPREQLIGTVQSMVFRNEDTLVASTNTGQTASVWVLDGSAVSEPVFVQPGTYGSSAVSPARDSLALGLEDGSIQILDFIRGERLLDIGHFPDPILSMAFGYLGEYFAFGSAASDSIIWDLKDNESAVSFLSSLILYQENKGGVTAVAFGPNGQNLVTGFENGSLNLWGLSGEKLEGNIPWFAQRTGISSLAISPDGAIIAAGGFDQTLTLWSVETRQQIGGALTGAESVVTSLVFHPSGLQLLAGQADGAIAAWDLDLASWVANACALVGRNLTPAEWDAFFPGEPYRETCSN